MRMSGRMLLAALVVLSCGTICFAEQIDNPAYASWAKFKPGTTVTRKANVDMGTQKMTTEIVTTLVEVTPEKVVVENKMSMPGMDMPARQTDIPAKIEKPVAPATEPAAKAQVKESSEEVEVAGKKIKCKVVEATMEMAGKSVTSKVWTSDEVPGGMVKSESKPAGGGPGGSTTEITAMTIK